MILKEPTPELLKACSIAAQVREYARTLVKPGASLLEVTDKLEKRIHELGAEPAFPTQLSLNHIAAHNYPDAGEKLVLSNEVVKIDVGVHVKGYIGDTAVTVDLSGKYGKMVEAAEAALAAAIKVVKPGVELRQIGAAILGEISKRGFSPVRNLSGHGLDSFEIHSAPNIPNYDNGDTTRLEKGQLIAIEPFATDGAGIVQEGAYATLFALVKEAPVRLPAARKIMKYIAENYGELVFAKRWLKAKFPAIEVEFALRTMLQAGIVRAYPPLGEQQRGIVTQAEHTVLVTDPALVLTSLSQQS